MFRQLHEIRGMQVISQTEGRVMGSIQKVYLNPAKKTVSGLVLREPGFGGQESWVDIKDVEMVGEDVLFVNRAAACKAKAPVGRSLKDLMGMQVTSKDGKILGSLVDVEIDEEWRVVELNLSEGRLVKIDPRQAVFGQDAILLRAGASAQVRTAPRHKTGFLARVFGIEQVQETAGAITRAQMAASPHPQPEPPKKRKKPRKVKARKK